jgi:carboxypeptidase C (cathepsin A)
MLYIDQPVQVGFSYDSLVNVTTNLLTGEVNILNDTMEIPQQNNTLLVGTFPSQNPNMTSRGSRNAAMAIWHFAQIWFEEFPGYRTTDDRISISTQSYGGRYGPAIMSTFLEQNEKIRNGTQNGTVLEMDTLVIVNGCIDRQTQWPSYPHIAYNNTYGIEAINFTLYNQSLNAYERPGGCRDQINDCHTVARVFDPANTGINATVNQICSAAEGFCTREVRAPYIQTSGRNYYDITQVNPIPFPYPFTYGYLNQPHVQAALGVPLNWTSGSRAVSSAFTGIGDYPRPGWKENIALFLENGIKVSLMYGDRDYACNWIGGETLSLSINYNHTTRFHMSGYAPLLNGNSTVGGQVRQYGNFSFVRVYQAGHSTPSYEPETAYNIFHRALFNRDIATGTIDTVTNKEYSTKGPLDTWSIKNEVPEQIPRFCYILESGTCTDEQVAGILAGNVTIKNWILVDKNSTGLFPELLVPGF